MNDEQLSGKNDKQLVQIDESERQKWRRARQRERTRRFATRMREERRRQRERTRRRQRERTRRFATRMKEEKRLLVQNDESETKKWRRARQCDRTPVKRRS